MPERSLAMPVTIGFRRGAKVFAKLTRHVALVTETKFPGNIDQR